MTPAVGEDDQSVTKHDRSDPGSYPGAYSAADRRVDPDAGEDSGADSGVQLDFAGPEIGPEIDFDVDAGARRSRNSGGGRSVPSCDRAVMVATTRLLTDVASGGARLASIGACLDELKRSLGVERLGVAVDDPVHGRQVFNAARTPIPERSPLETLLWGEARVVCEPSTAFTRAANDLLLAAVAHTIEWIDPELRTALRGAAGRAARAGRVTSVAVVEHLGERAREDMTELVSAIRDAARIGEFVGAFGASAFVVVMEATPSDQVPAALARLGGEAGLGPVVFGVAAVPADATEPDEILRIAQSRLMETRRSTDQSEEFARRGSVRRGRGGRFADSEFGGRAGGRRPQQ